MNIGTMQFKSEALRRHVSYSVILPETGPGPYPVLMQLHGFSDDHTAWLNFSNLVRHAKEYPFIIVLPDGGTSFYLDLDPMQQYETFLMEDIYRHVNATFQVRPGPWAIGGLSMGGFGALRLGLKYPERFASIWAHSSAAYSKEELPPFVVLNREEGCLYGVAERYAAQPLKRTVTFDCGTEDFLINQNRNFHAHLDKLGVAHRYAEHDGAHTWEYWDLHVREALAQHMEVVGR